MPNIVITKVGSGTPAPAPRPAPAAAPVAAPVAAPAPVASARKGKTMRTFPKGILKKTAKVKPVKDPAKSPPLRKGVRKHSVRVLTEKGMEGRRKTLRSKIRRMKDEEVRATLQKAGVAHNPKTPPHILRDMLEGGAEAGMISI